MYNRSELFNTLNSRFFFGLLFVFFPNWSDHCTNCAPYGQFECCCENFCHEVNEDTRFEAC